MVKEGGGLLNSTLSLLLICYRRQDYLTRMERYVANWPGRVFIFCDGPKSTKASQEVQDVQSTQAKAYELGLRNKHVSVRIERRNNGCRWGPINAISWANKHSEQTVVLEDDCIPSDKVQISDFFGYSLGKSDKIIALGPKEFLEKRREDAYEIESLFFHSWGWICKRRIWEGFDPTFDNWPLLKKGIVRRSGLRSSQRRWLIAKGDFLYSTRREQDDVWDSLFMLHLIATEQNILLARKELVKYIGYDGKATHTKEAAANGRIASVTACSSEYDDIFAAECLDAQGIFSMKYRISSWIWLGLYRLKLIKSLNTIKSFTKGR